MRKEHSIQFIFTLNFNRIQFSSIRGTMVQTVCKPLGHRPSSRCGSRALLHSGGVRPSYFQNIVCNAVENAFDPLVLDECSVFQVSPLTKENIPQASVVITRAFARSPQYIPIDECRRYCCNRLEQDESEGIMLVGTMSPGPDCPDSGQSYLPEGQSNNCE